MKSQSLSIQMKTNYAAALSCGTVYYAVQNGFNFWVCRWNRKVGPSSEIYWVVLCCLPCCTRWYKLLSLWMKPLSVSLQMKSTEEYFPIVLFIMLYKVVLTFESVDEILKCGHSDESYWAVLSRGTVYYAVRGGSNFWICLKSTYNNHYSQMALFSNICTVKFGICLECCFSSLLQAELWTFFSSFRSHGW